MAVVTYPGVYVEEVSSGVRPIQAASTSIAAFFGVAEKGTLNDAVKVYNFTEYENLYGGFLSSSYLSHAVYQFFNNGGSQCYVIRVAGENTATANIVIRDRGTTPQDSLTIAAVSPGIWGNDLALVIEDGTNDAGNEFNLHVFTEDGTTAVETFKNLSMAPDASNFVEMVTSSSSYIRVTVNQGNTNAQAGTSVGNAAPAGLEGTGRTRFRINIDGDGYHDVDLAEAVGSGTGQVADLTADNVAEAITYVVSRLVKFLSSTDQDSFDDFSCTGDSTTPLVLTSGTDGLNSSVTVAPASMSSQDATGLLQIGKLAGGTEILGSAVTRPLNSPISGFFFIGDHALPATEVESVTAGLDGDHPSDSHYIDAFSVLDDVEDVSLIAVPGESTTAVMAAGMNYCETTRPLSDCFFIGDMSQDEDTVEEAKAFRDALSTKNSYGAVYVPWVSVVDPTGQSPEPILIPPSGFVSGLYAKTDAKRGVWKAPAGTAVSLGGSVGLAVNFTDVQQGNLNPINVNVIRQFASSGIVLWGARTITSDAEWNYVPVRRMAIFLRVSIYRGIQWAVFEPNDEPLWASLRLNITSFMMTLYRQGAFQGSKPSDAFFVKCDSETTTQDDINLGIVNILVGFAPLKPAEFVVVKISQKAGQSS